MHSDCIRLIKKAIDDYKKAPNTPYITRHHMEVKIMWLEGYVQAMYDLDVLYHNEYEDFNEQLFKLSMIDYQNTEILKK